MFGALILITTLLLSILISIQESKMKIIESVGDLECAISQLSDKIDDHHAPISMMHLQSEEENHEDC